MNKHNNQVSTPPAQAPLVLVKLKESYKLWHNYLINLKRVDRYSIGVQIDRIFLYLLELIFRGSFAHDKFEKLSLISQAIAKNDLLKFHLQLAWENKIIDHKNYASLIIQLDNVGRMLGGWKKSLDLKTATTNR